MGGAGATPIPNARTSLNFPDGREKRISLGVNCAFDGESNFISVAWLDMTVPPAAEFSGYRSEPAGNWQRNWAQGWTLDLTTWITLEQTETSR
jgi:hypothetical protein